MSALALLGTVITIGGVVLWILGEGEYTLWQAIYFAIITVSTVGYGELPHFENHTGSRVVTGVLIIAGIGAIAFFQSTLTALLVEGAIGKLFRKRRMQKKVDSYHDHYIVCGAGRVGRAVVHELVQTDCEFVVIDKDESHLERLGHDLGVQLVYVIGDATEDAVLQEAGVKRAAGLVCSLTSDPQNLFVTLSARSINPDLRIVTKVVEHENEAKMKMAGAQTTVSPNLIGGSRLASELTHPKLVRFLDDTMSVEGTNLRFDELEMSEQCKYAGQTLRQMPIREHANLLVIATRDHTGELRFNPKANERIEAGMHMIVIGPPADINKLREMLHPKLPPASRLGMT